LLLYIKTGASSFYGYSAFCVLKKMTKNIAIVNSIILFYVSKVL